MVCQCDAGNLVDAAILATVSIFSAWNDSCTSHWFRRIKCHLIVFVGQLVALRNLTLPAHEVEADSSIIFLSSKTTSPRIVCKLPLPVTCSLFDDAVLVDPTEQEEELQKGSLTCIFDETGNIIYLNQVMNNLFSNFHLWNDVDDTVLSCFALCCVLCCAL